MKLSPHLVFDGRCEEAFRFYERVLGGRVVTMLRYGDSPMADQVAPEWHRRIVHVTLDLGDGVVLNGVDALPDDFERPQGFYVLIQPDEPAEATRVFNLLAEGGEIRTPVQPTFWSPCFGVLIDQFGIPREISCEAEA
jgi:PhnB protein